MKGIILFGGLQGGGPYQRHGIYLGGALFFKNGFLLAKTDSRANTALVI